MTPTREQLAELLEEVKRWIYHQQPAEEDNARKKLDHVIACLAAPPPEPQAMPPIEPGDWVQDAAGEIRRVMDSDHISWLRANRTIYEIRKANGTVWRRPAPDRSDR